LSAGSAAVDGIYSTSRILPGWTVTGPGIPDQTTVVQVESPTRVSMSAKATANGPTVVQFEGEPPSCFGDDPSILVPGHKILAGNLLGPQTYLYSISDNTFTPSGTKVYDDSSDSVRVGGNRPETVDFTLNPAVTPGRYELTVVGAGIASRAFRIRIPIPIHRQH